MRFPLEGQESSAIDKKKSIKMLEYAIDHGVNYLDTAYGYHGGESETFIGESLCNGYRDKVKLATKLPTWLVKNKGDFDKFLNEQLLKLQTDCIDFYLLHSLNQKNWAKVRDLNVLEWAEAAISDGRIKHLGFSFHDNFTVFKEIVDAYDNWVFCQIQYNYMDIKNQAGLRGLRYASSKGLAIVIMEPILGGRLVYPPKRIVDIWESAEKKRKPADWALQWLWDQPEVSVVLSGMSTMEQVAENISSANTSAICSLTLEDLDLIDRVREEYIKISPIPCTKCEYCLPCAHGVNMPRNFDIYNQGIMFEKMESARNEYNNWFAEEERAHNCQECLDCLELCPQKIEIPQWLQIIDQSLSLNIQPM
jgi:predicted aldo/keto reductase-like oxidoreductase